MNSSSIRTFNSAKKFAEEILHPLISSHTNAKLKTRMGAVNDEEASKISSNQRVINRFNALKERIILQQTLISEIEATVRLNGAKCEIDLIEELKEQLSILENNFDKNSDDILQFKLIQGIKRPILTKLFKECGVFLDATYVQVQKLMTKNKLLFYSDNDDYLEDQELKEKIKSDNRSV